MTEHLLCCHLINDAKQRLIVEERGKGYRTVYTDISLEIDLAEVYFRNLDRGAYLLHSLEEPPQAVINVVEDFLDEAHAFMSVLVWRMLSPVSGSLMKLIYRYIIEAAGRMFINCYAAFAKCFDADPVDAWARERLIDRLKELVPSISLPVDERETKRRESFEEELYS